MIKLGQVLAINTFLSGKREMQSQNKKKKKSKNNKDFKEIFESEINKMTKSN